MHLPVPVSSPAKGGERPESHLPGQPCREVEVYPAGVTTPGQVKLHLWERATCLLLPPSAALTGGPVPWSRLCKTMQRLCKTFSLLWLMVGALPGLSTSTRSCCTLFGKPSPLHVPCFLISQTGCHLNSGFSCRIPKGTLCWG